MSVEVLHGDSRELIRTFAAASIDACVTDPPYALKFMGKDWDTGEAAFDPEFWRDVLRVLKPGAHLLAFGGTRTYHRLACAIEDAGFEIRDQIGWAFGSGFPKSHNIGDGWGTALKPAWEPVCLARKPFAGTVADNVLEHGTGALNIDVCRVAIAPDDDSGGWGNGRRASGFGDVGSDAGDTKPNGERHHLGRWPANIVHDGSDEVMAAFPDSKSCDTPSAARCEGEILGGSRTQGAIYPGENGSAARFFYTAKADLEDRIGSNHPTIKPVDLMQWLIRLITPKGGLILDPFAGSGTTGEAAIREGCRAILIEREELYVRDIERRMRLAHSGRDERRRESIKASGKKPKTAAPLFGEPSS